MFEVYTRFANLPEHSFFLFGPRGTGKTTWLKTVLPQAKWFNLLRNKELLTLMRNPDRLRQEVLALKPNSWIVIDEVQKLPPLLNEIQDILVEHGDRYKFAMSGSSARKLRRMDSNLLAGRAIERRFFPLTGAELGFDFSLEELLRVGSLPEVHLKPRWAFNFLETYAATYLKEEIQQEALVHNIGSFSRFLEVAALVNGEIVNTSSIARDAGVARPTVQRYFDTLIDTLIGSWLPAWRPKKKVKESAHPKFYFFDCGVVRALSGRLREPLDSNERGSLLETLVLHELRAWNSYADLAGSFYYYRTPANLEIDFIWKRGDTAIGIEVKSSSQWRGEYSRCLKDMLSLGSLSKGFGVYLGEQILQDGSVRVFPLKDFMRALSQGALSPTN